MLFLPLKNPSNVKTEGVALNGKVIIVVGVASIVDIPPESRLVNSTYKLAELGAIALVCIPAKLLSDIAFDKTFRLFATGIAIDPSSVVNCVGTLGG